jgi:hypothetical protein
VRSGRGTERERGEARAAIGSLLLDSHGGGALHVHRVERGEDRERARGLERARATLCPFQKCERGSRARGRG